MNMTRKDDNSKVKNDRWNKRSSVFKSNIRLWKPEGKKEYAHAGIFHLNRRAGYS